MPAAQQLQESLLPALEWGGEKQFLTLAELKYAGFKKLLRSLSNLQFPFDQLKGLKWF